MNKRKIKINIPFCFKKTKRVLGFKHFFFQLIKAEQVVNKKWELTDEGKDVAANGSHEARVYYTIPDGGIAQAAVMVSKF